MRPLDNERVKALTKTKVYIHRTAYSYYIKHRHKFLKVLSDVLRKQGYDTKLVFVYDLDNSIINSGLLVNNVYMNIMGVHHNFYDYIEEVTGVHRTDIHEQVLDAEVIDNWLKKYFDVTPFNRKEYEKLERFIVEKYLPSVMK